MTVDKSVEALMSYLGKDTYETKTRGTRETPAARIVAEGAFLNPTITAFASC